MQAKFSTDTVAKVARAALDHYEELEAKSEQLDKTMVQRKMEACQDIQRVTNLTRVNWVMLDQAEVRLLAPGWPVTKKRTRT